MYLLGETRGLILMDTFIAQTSFDWHDVITLILFAQDGKTIVLECTVWKRLKFNWHKILQKYPNSDINALKCVTLEWRKEELDRINTTLTGAERKAALCVLLEQETQLIGSIGRHKLDAESENRLNRIQGFLDKAAAPKRWKGPDGNTTQMDTPYTIRAQQLRDIYNTINMKYLTQDERLDVLLTLKHTVKVNTLELNFLYVRYSAIQYFCIHANVTQSGIYFIRCVYFPNFSLSCSKKV